MNYFAFFDSLKKGELQTVYVFEGVEEYIKSQAIKRLCEKLLPEGLEAMNQSILHNPAADELIAAVETLPMMADQRVVLVEDYAPLTQGKGGADDGVDKIMEYLPTASPSTCLVFRVKGKADGRKKLYAYLKKRGAVVDFSPMNEQQAVDWVIRTMRVLGKQMNASVAQRFVFTVGNDASMMKQEIEKLADYTGERSEVTKADIEAISVQTPECTVFQMVDAQVAGEYDKAMVLMRNMLTSGVDRIMILAMLLRQYRMLYHAKCLAEEHVPQSKLASLLKIPPFAANRLQAQARRYNKEKLKAVYDYLLDYEYRIKSGRIAQDGCAEVALIQMKSLLDEQQQSA